MIIKKAKAKDLQERMIPLAIQWREECSVNDFGIETSVPEFLKNLMDNFSFPGKRRKLPLLKTIGKIRKGHLPLLA